MTNPWRGEVQLGVDNAVYDLRLTLGALAELEAEMQADIQVALVQRFEAGTCSSLDVLAVLRAGLKGAKVDPMPDLAGGVIQGGPMKAAQVAATLLVRAFAMPEVQSA